VPYGDLGTASVVPRMEQITHVRLIKLLSVRFNSSICPLIAAIIPIVTSIDSRTESIVALQHVREDILVQHAATYMTCPLEILLMMKRYFSTIRRILIASPGGELIVPFTVTS
jgi:hypothetical protein